MADQVIGPFSADRVDLHLVKVLSLPMQREVGRDHLSSSRYRDSRESHIVLLLRDLLLGRVEAEVVAGMPLIPGELRIESFELRSAEESTAPTVTGTILIHGLPVRVLFDMGATHSFISDACVGYMSLVTTEGTPFSIGLPDGSRVIGTHEIFCLSHLCRDLCIIC